MGNFGLQWVRVALNGSLETVNTAKGGRFSESECQGSTVELNITQTKMGDSGHYYCGVWQIGYFIFYGEGTSLLVGKFSVCTSTINLTLL